MLRCDTSSPEKMSLLSSVNVFQSDCEDWIRQETYWSTSTGSKWILLCYSGRITLLFWWTGADMLAAIIMTVLHKLSTSSLQWKMLSPSASECEAPMERREIVVMVKSVEDGEEKTLYVVAGSQSYPISIVNVEQSIRLLTVKMTFGAMSANSLFSTLPIHECIVAM